MDRKLLVDTAQRILSLLSTSPQSYLSIKKRLQITDDLLCNALSHLESSQQIYTNKSGEYCITTQ